MEFSNKKFMKLASHLPVGSGGTSQRVKRRLDVVREILARNKLARDADLIIVPVVAMTTIVITH